MDFLFYDENITADYENENILLFNNDCLNILKSIPNNSIDLVVTDPPYRVCNCGRGTKKEKTKYCGGILAKDKKLTRDGKLFQYNNIKFCEWLLLLYNKLKDNSHCYIFISCRHLAELQMEAEKVGFKYQQIIVWDKGNATPCHYYMNAIELVLMLRKGNAKDIKNMGTKNILRFPNKVGYKSHPTQKNIDMLEVFINNSSNERRYCT